MQSFKNKRVLRVIFVFMGFAAAFGQSKIEISWEIRSYYIDADDPQVEVFLLTDDGIEKKELVFFSSGEAIEVNKSGHYLLSTWYMYATFEYRYLIESKNIRIQKQELEYSKKIGDFVPISPGWKDIKNIPIASGKGLIPKTGVTVLAKLLFHRPLSLQVKRMNGDDVWALQRFLVEQGYTEVGIIDGWFGPNTEKAVKRFQKDRQMAEDGVVGQAVWDLLSGLEKDQVNFFRGDYGG